MFACYALACELYLKSLITIETGGFPREAHDLQKYLSHLSKDAQDQIRSSATISGEQRLKQWQETAKANGDPVPPNYDFDTALGASRKAFENWRYVFEKEFKPGEAWQGGEIMNAVRNIIIGRHPEWGPPLHFR